jgi:hypothetical protein
MSEQTVTFAWWNVENLFPPGQHPNWGDWDEALFDEKLAHVGQVIQAMGSDNHGPDLLGLCEVADQQVLQTLVQRHLSDLGYHVVHHESPDLRGIDVAFLYRDTVFQPHPDLTQAHTIVKRIPTRDIFEVYLTVRTNGAMLVVLGNHWPSRSAGVYESEPFRIMAAEQCSVIVDELRERNDGVQLLVLGDFNDDPFSRSVREYLLAIRDKERVLSRRTRRPYLYNCMWRLMEAAEPGTFYYTGGETPWFMFDQVIVSPGLLRPEGGLQLLEDLVAVFRPSWLRRRNGAPKPFRKLGGRLVEGFSDHFPVVGQLAVVAT